MRGQGGVANFFLKHDHAKRLSVALSILPRASKATPLPHIGERYILFTLDTRELPP